MTGSPRKEFQRVCVTRSYISLLLRYSRPDVPNVVASPFIFAEYTIPAPQSVHHITEIGSPPTMSLAIS